LRTDNDMLQQPGSVRAPAGAWIVLLKPESD
jgi:hypothetical protein